jgi:hypothetical protein
MTYLQRGDVVLIVIDGESDKRRNRIVEDPATSS